MKTVIQNAHTVHHDLFTVTLTSTHTVHCQRSCNINWMVIVRIPPVLLEVTIIETCLVNILVKATSLLH